MRTGLILAIVTWLALSAGYAASGQSPSESAARTSRGFARDAGHAAPARHRYRPTGKKTSAAPDHPRTSEKNPGRGHAGVPVATHPKQPLTKGEPSRSGSAVNFHASSLNRSSGVTKDGSIQTHTGTSHRTLPVRSPGMARTTAPSFSNVRHRSLNPAAIGGPASSSTRNTAALNGTQMGRRPGRN